MKSSTTGFRTLERKAVGALKRLGTISLVRVGDVAIADGIELRNTRNFQSRFTCEHEGFFFPDLRKVEVINAECELIKFPGIMSDGSWILISVQTYQVPGGKVALRSVTVARKQLKDICKKIDRSPDQIHSAFVENVRRVKARFNSQLKKIQAALRFAA